MLEDIHLIVKDEEEGEYSKSFLQTDTTTKTQQKKISIPLSVTSYLL